MKDKTFTGEALEKALANDELSHPGLELLGMVKASEQKKHISFTLSGCDDWVDLPTGMIEQAEQVGSSRCEDHSHPVFKLTLKKPETSEAQILSTLLAQRPPSRHADPIPTRPMQGSLPAVISRIGRRGAFGGSRPVMVPPTNVAYWPEPDGSWRCSGWVDCVNMINDIGCASIKCEPGWATGDVVCHCTPW